MTILGSIILTGTSLAPVLFIYAVVAFLEGELAPAVALVFVGVVLVGLGVAVLTYVKGHLERMSLTISGAKVADRESVGLLVLYLLPLLRTSFVDLELIVLVPAIAIFLALALTGHNYHFNPLLIGMGWKFYKVSTPEGITYLLITRKSLISTVDKITIRRLTAHTLIDAGGSN